MQIYGWSRSRHGVLGKGIAAAVLAVVVTALFVAVVHRSPADTGSTLGQTQLLLRGVPQDGITLGSIAAPATLTIYDRADNVAAVLDPATLGPLLQRYVKPGRLRIQVRPQTDTVQMALAGATPVERLLQAAGVQNHLWDLWAVMGWSVTDESVYNDEARALAAQVPGLNAATLLSDARSVRVVRADARAQAYGTRAGYQFDPVYTLQATRDGATTKLNLNQPGWLLGRLRAALGT